jgi:hypothetical protein
MDTDKSHSGIGYFHVLYTTNTHFKGSRYMRIVTKVRLAGRNLLQMYIYTNQNFTLGPMLFCKHEFHNYCNSSNYFNFLHVTRTWAHIFPQGKLTMWPPLWSSDQRFWLQIQRSRVRFPALLDFWQVGGLQRGPLSLVITTEELLEKRSSGSGLEKPRLTALGIRWADHVTPSTRKKSALLRWQRRSLGRYSSLAD